MSKTVLITGVQGFLGPYIAREFVSHNYRVVGTCRSSGPLAQTDVSNLLVAELSSQEFEALLTTTKPDLIVHAAGPSSVGASVANPATDFRGSADVFYHLLDAVRRLTRDSKVLLLSSAAVYGNPEKLPVHEDTPLRPISPYGFHKKICEILVEEFYSVYGIRGCSVRIFSAYGQGLRRQVLWDISRKALCGEVVRLEGTGDETRDFVHAEDVASGLRVIADKAAFAAKAYNLSYGTATTIREVAQTIIAELGRNCAIDFSQMRRAGDPLFWQADITRLSQLGYEPRISFAQGAASYAKWVLAKIKQYKRELK